MGPSRDVNGKRRRDRRRRDRRSARCGTPEVSDDTGAIQRYLDDLEHALIGPRRLKADMLTEARHGLDDAAEAYQEAGVAVAEAGRSAVRDFGPIDVVAPEFQAELAIAQGRRTALLLLVALGVQPIGWRFVERPGQGTGYALVREAVGWLGAAGLIGAVLAVLACSVGARVGGGRPGVAAAIGGFSGAMCCLLVGCGVLLTAWGSGGAIAALWLALLLGVPLSAVAVNARRCLPAA